MIRPTTLSCREGEESGEDGDKGGKEELFVRYLPAGGFSQDLQVSSPANGQRAIDLDRLPLE